MQRVVFVFLPSTSRRLEPCAINDKAHLGSRLDLARRTGMIVDEGQPGEWESRPRPPIAG